MAYAQASLQPGLSVSAEPSWHIKQSRPDSGPSLSNFEVTVPGTCQVAPSWLGSDWSGMSPARALRVTIRSFRDFDLEDGSSLIIMAQSCSVVCSRF